eukprot:scaffold1854_cov113-Isochrysis_galbana.AAC.14
MVLQLGISNSHASGFLFLPQGNSASTGRLLLVAWRRCAAAGGIRPMPRASLTSRHPSRAAGTRGRGGRGAAPPVRHASACRRRSPGPALRRRWRARAPGVGGRAARGEGTLQVVYQYQRHAQAGDGVVQPPRRRRVTRRDGAVARPGHLGRGVPLEHLLTPTGTGAQRAAVAAAHVVRRRADQRVRQPRGGRPCACAADAEQGAADGGRVKRDVGTAVASVEVVGGTREVEGELGLGGRCGRKRGGAGCGAGEDGQGCCGGKEGCGRGVALTTHTEALAEHHRGSCPGGAGGGAVGAARFPGGLESSSPPRTLPPRTREPQSPVPTPSPRAPQGQGVHAAGALGTRTHLHKTRSPRTAAPPGTCPRAAPPPSPKRPHSSRASRS